jgi:ABC-2 type transport system ATP-binding protein
MHPIIVENLEKSYDTTQAVKKVSFEVQKGEIFGLIGPDGAGKTTILRSVVSLLEPDSGHVYFNGKEVCTNTSYVRSHIGYMPQKFSLYPDLTVEQNLNFFGDLFRVPREAQKKRIGELYQFSKLESFKDRRAGKLSGGMKQKLALSCMLIHEPEVIVLDEPTFGVDPVSRTEFWEILHILAKREIALLLTTAYMDEASQCDRIALILDGEILAMDYPNKLVSKFEVPVYLIQSENLHKAHEKIQQTEYSNNIQLFGSGIHFLDRNNLGRDGISSFLSDIDVKYNSIELIKPDLENVFLDQIMLRDN